VNGTKFHQGALMISHRAHCKSTGEQNIYSQSSNPNTIILSANSSETVGFEMPYIGPREWFNLSHDTEGESKGYFGLVQAWVLAPLTLSSAVSTATITVSVVTQFVNAELAGPSLFSGVSSSFKGEVLEGKALEYHNSLTPPKGLGPTPHTQKNNQEERFSGCYKTSFA